MSERFDAQRLSPHDLEVMRRRVSFSEWEVNIIVDRLIDLMSGYNTKELLDYIERAQEARARLTKLTSDDKIYQLTRKQAEDIDVTIGELSYALEIAHGIAVDIPKGD